MHNFSNRPKFTIRQLATAGLIAAVYASLTLFLPIPPFDAVQLRLAEAMTVLPFLFPEAVLGLTVGCFLVNLMSPFLLDCVFGTLATLLAALWTSKVKHIWLAPLPPVICNGLIVGAEIAWFAVQQGEQAAFLPAWGMTALSVGLEEGLVCFGLGLPLLCFLRRSPAFRARIAVKN